MPAKRKRHKPEFKAQVALEAYRGDKTINQLACEHEVAAVQVSQWKRQLLQGVPEVFVNASLNWPFFIRLRCPGSRSRRARQLHGLCGAGSACRVAGIYGRCLPVGGGVLRLLAIQLERLKAGVRAKVEDSLRIIKCQFGLANLVRLDLMIMAQG